MSVDGTDFPIREPIPFQPGYFSHKIHASALRYEVGVAVHSGFIVWVNGPYPAGWTDINIFRDELKFELSPTEKIIADKGYQGENSIETPGTGFELKISKQNTLRARHENVNRSIKIFKSIHDKSRNDSKKHKLMFYSVAVIVQIGFLINGPQYEVQ